MRRGPTIGRRLLLGALLAHPVACAAPPAPRPRPGDRFRRVHVGLVIARSRHLDPLVPIFRASLVERLRRLPGVVEALDDAPEPRPPDAVLLRGELADDTEPFLRATAATRTLAGRFELWAPDGTLLQRFFGHQRYAGGPGVAAFSAQGLIDLARLFGVTVAEAVGRWLAGDPLDLPAGGAPRRDGRQPLRAS